MHSDNDIWTTAARINCLYELVNSMKYEIFGGGGI